MRLRHKKSAVLLVAAAFILLVPLTARAFIGTVPVIDWTAVVRIGQEIGISQGTLNTLGLYVQQYSRVNAGVQNGIRLVRGRQLEGVLNQTVGSEFPQFQQLQRDFNSALVDPAILRGDLEGTYGTAPTTDFPLERKQRIDATDATATLGLLEASRAELVSQQEDLDADDIESDAAVASPGGAAKLSAAANGAMLRSQAYNQRLTGELMRLQALNIARENSIEKEQEQIREGQVSAVSNLVGSMQLSYGIGDLRGQ
ncbi:MAG TPA: hypothetical protein VMF91_22910 [Bryobacteraceae bacterium]|nr:hypothetical protein [Bryobacteraceae bacterium]